MLKKPKYLLWGIIPAVCYAVLAGLLGWSELHCNNLLLCGYVFGIVTFPSQFTLGQLLEGRGIRISFGGTPAFSDFGQVALHVGVCTVLVFVVCYSFARFIVWLNNYNERLNTRDYGPRPKG